MRCEHVQDRALELFLDGETELPEGLSPHVAACPTCTQEIAQIRRSIDAIQNAIPALAVDPPKGMKESVFARIDPAAAKANSAKANALPAPPKPVSRAGGGWFRNLVLRPMPIAAAASVLFIVAFGISAKNHRDTGRYMAVIESVESAGALDTLEALEARDWVNSPTETWRLAVVRDARHELERAEAAGSASPEDVLVVRGAIIERNLVHAFMRLNTDAPAEDKGSVARIQDCLEDIVALEP